MSASVHPNETHGVIVTEGLWANVRKTVEQIIEERRPGNLVIRGAGHVPQRGERPSALISTCE